MFYQIQVDAVCETLETKLGASDVVLQKTDEGYKVLVCFEELKHYVCVPSQFIVWHEKDQKLRTALQALLLANRHSGAESAPLLGDVQQWLMHKLNSDHVVCKVYDGVIMYKQREKDDEIEIEFSKMGGAKVYGGLYDAFFHKDDCGLLREVQFYENFTGTLYRALKPSSGFPEKGIAFVQLCKLAADANDVRNSKYEFLKEENRMSVNWQHFGDYQRDWASSHANEAPQVCDAINKNAEYALHWLVPELEKYLLDKLMERCMVNGRFVVTVEATSSNRDDDLLRMELENGEVVESPCFSDLLFLVNGNQVRSLYKDDLGKPLHGALCKSSPSLCENFLFRTISIDTCVHVALEKTGRVMVKRVRDGKIEFDVDGGPTEYVNVDGLVHLLQDYNHIHYVQGFEEGVRSNGVFGLDTHLVRTGSFYVKGLEDAKRLISKEA